MGWFNFGGVKSSDYGVVVENCATRSIPTPQQSVWNIPGRNGDFLRRLDNRYQNYIQEYEVYMDCASSEWEDRAREFAFYLAAGGQTAPTGVDKQYNPAGVGYGYLTDSYDSTTEPSYRCAYFEGPVDIANTLMRFGRATVRFNCKPQRYLISGAQPVALSAGVNTITPPSLAAGPTYPFILLSTQPMTFELQFDSSGIPKYKAVIEHLGNSVIDCENWMIEYSGIKMPQDLQPINSYELPEFNGYLKITPDDPSDVVEMKIWPRWWVL